MEAGRGAILIMAGRFHGEEMGELEGVPGEGISKCVGALPTTGDVNKSYK